jgi:hypothetical protein
MNIFQEILVSAFVAKTLDKQVSLFDINSIDVDFYHCTCQLDDSIYPSCANNYAVAAMHLGKVESAVHMLESIIQKDPSRYLIDAIVFNLCTMYDISFSPQIAEMKKKTLQSIGSIYWVRDVTLNSKSFRLGY